MADYTSAPAGPVPPPPETALDRMLAEDGDIYEPGASSPVPKTTGQLWPR